MKATGIVRTLDPLGRIVIPIELRRTMGIKDGDKLEVFTEDGGHIILRKFCIEGVVEDSLRLIEDQIKDYTPEIAETIRSHLAGIRGIIPKTSGPIRRRAV